MTVRTHHPHPREHSEVVAGRAWKAHATAVVRDAGLRAGGGRAAVIDVLADERCVVSAHDIVDRLQRRGSRGANLATVYRALEVLHELHLLTRLDAGDGTARYERAAPDGDHHHHVLYPMARSSPSTTRSSSRWSTRSPTVSAWISRGTTSCCTRVAATRPARSKAQLRIIFASVWGMRAPVARFLTALAATSALLIAGCGGDGGGDGRPVAAATAPQLQALVDELAGSGVQVAEVVPPTADVHELELRPSQVKALREAALILRPGRGNDAWAQEALSEVDATQVDASKGVGGDARHWWMDPRAASTAITTVATALNDLDPDGATERDRRAEALRKELATIDRQTTQCLASVPASRRKIVTDHDAAGAYAARYGLTVVGTISPGAEPEAAPSAARVVALVRTMKATGVRAVFPIAPHGSQLAATIAKRAGAVLGEPLWADALPGATHDHAHEGESHDEHAEAGHEGEKSEESATLAEAARRNGEAVSEALGARGSACSALRE